MILTIVIAALAASGMLLILWLVFDALLSAKETKDSFYVVLLKGNAAQVQQTMRSALRQREWQGLRATVVFVDEGIDCEGQLAAELFLRRRENAILCSRSQLTEIIRTENEDIGAGAD